MNCYSRDSKDRRTTSCNKNVFIASSKCIDQNSRGEKGRGDSIMKRYDDDLLFGSEGLFGNSKENYLIS